MTHEKTSALSMQQEAALGFFFSNRGRWFNGTNLHDEAQWLNMNTLNSLVRKGLIEKREGYHYEFSYKEQIKCQN